MARRNTGSSSNYLSLGSALATDFPVTLAAWFRPASVTVNSNLVNISSSSGNYVALAYDGANSYGGGARAVIADVGENFAASASAPNVAGQWVHCAAVAAGLTSRTGYMNGRPGTTGTGGVSNLGTMTNTNIGIYPGGFSPLNGVIADVAIWTDELTPGEIRELAQGARPGDIRPQSLAAWWPLDDANLLDRTRRLRMVQTGTMGYDTQPEILRARGRSLAWLGDVAAPSFNPAWALGANTILQSGVTQ